jgi:hypothetical protein
MDNHRSCLLLKYLNFGLNTNPPSDSDENWELLIQQARAAGVLSRLAFFWKRFNLFQPPCFATKHLESAEKYWLSQKRIVDWELYHLKQVFKQLRLPLVLLKGTAYLAANLDVGFGRVFNDIDILVPRERLFEVKDALKWHGWFPEPLDTYDKRYYERWMHELPPLRHIKRKTSLDVHHNILPLTCGLHPDADLLLSAIVEIPGSDLWILAPEDMVLHSACHLFWGGEFENGLRDLSDIDLLLRQFSDKDGDFWRKLVERSACLGLSMPLFYALRYTRLLLSTPVPPEYIEISKNFGNQVNIGIMDRLFLRALKPDHPSCDDLWTPLARWLLYVRAHWLRMPWYLLIPHLSRKAWKKLVEPKQH